MMPGVMKRSHWNRSRNSNIVVLLLRHARPMAVAALSNFVRAEIPVAGNGPF
jgi:hypothetical protein